ncbi:MAG: amidase [Rhodospirillales bacterium]
MGAKKLSPVELVESCLKRIAAVNGTVNAFVALDEERALAQAREIEAEIAQGRDPGPLAGLPVGIKDLVNVKGLRSTYGSLLFKDPVPDADDGQITRLRDAGAIILGKTNTPEFGSGANTTNRVYGATTNPFDPARTPAMSGWSSRAWAKAWRNFAERARNTRLIPSSTGADPRSSEKATRSLPRSAG